MGLGADEVARLLALEAHPEGGWYRETWRDVPEGGGRGVGTAIYYLLRAGEESRWHRVDATEIWHFYAGGPLELSLSADGSAVERRVLGADLATGQHPQQVVPPAVWQSAKPLSGWALVGCTVSPAFEFTGFELAPEGWRPGP